MRHLATLLLTSLILSACSHNGTSFVVEKPVGGKSTTSFNTNISSGSGANTVTINTGSGSATTTISSNTVSTPITTKIDEHWFKPNLILNERPQSIYLVNKPEPRLQAEIEQALKDTNKLRAEKGLSPLVYDASLAAHAQRRAEEIAQLYAHQRPNGESYASGSSGFLSENITQGYKDSQGAVLTSWRNSQAHYQNMINPQYTKIGIGLVYVSGSQAGYQWVQIFGVDNTVSQYQFNNNPAKNNALTLKETEEWVTTTQDNPHWVFVAGRGISIPSHYASEQWQSFNNAIYQGVINGYQNVRYGMVQKSHGDYKTFIHGNHTPLASMPQSGNAIYSGYAAISDGQNVNTNLTSHLKANFSDKQLTGALAENGEKIIGIQAHIKGSHFYSPEQASVQTEGAFYGSHADAVGGMFLESSTGKYGTFGAKKQ
ncbi:MAG: CAP domain-containing protein [Cardiobacteriaceae bacterium]|nr:CAP domain-containing protein [Cardiobacteriaceae bacterium]